MICYNEPRKVKKLQYMLGSKKSSNAAIKYLLYDWAITISVNLWALGIAPRDKGNVTVPGTVILTRYLRDNVFK